MSRSSFASEEVEERRTHAVLAAGAERVPPVVAVVVVGLRAAALGVDEVGALLVAVVGRRLVAVGLVAVHGAVVVVVIVVVVEARVRVERGAVQEGERVGEDEGGRAAVAVGCRWLAGPGLLCEGRDWLGGGEGRVGRHGGADGEQVGRTRRDGAAAGPRRCASAVTL